MTPYFECAINHDKFVSAGDELIRTVAKASGNQLKDVLFVETMLAWADYMRYCDTQPIHEVEVYSAKYCALFNVINASGYRREFFEFRGTWREKFGL